MPDFMVADMVAHCPDVREVERQIGNAVPFVMAAEMAHAVYEAACGQPGTPPPDLSGPSPSGAGLRSQQELQQYNAWQQQHSQLKAAQLAEAELSRQVGQNHAADLAALANRRQRQPRH